MSSELPPQADAETYRGRTGLTDDPAEKARLERLAEGADRARIRALHAALSRREWSEVEQAAAAIRDAFNEGRPFGEHA